MYINPNSKSKPGRGSLHPMSDEYFNFYLTWANALSFRCLKQGVGFQGVKASKFHQFEGPVRLAGKAFSLLNEKKLIITINVNKQCSIILYTLRYNKVTVTLTITYYS